LFWRVFWFYGKISFGDEVMKVIAGKYKGRSLATLSGQLTRPTTGKVREAVFSSLQTLTPGSVWLDLFAGSGGIGIEALSRGAAFCHFVDSSRRACKIIRQNLENLKIQQAKIFCADAAAVCAKISQTQGKTVGIVYMDPPYAAEKEYRKVLAAIPGLLRPGGLMVIEHANNYTPEVEWAEHVKTKRYGLSVISYYKNEGENSQ